VAFTLFDHCSGDRPLVNLGVRQHQNSTERKVLTLLEAILLVVASVLGTLLVGTKAYTTEKGKNRAIREDLDSVTKALEQVKADAQASVEREKAGLEHIQLINRTQYELELAAYREVWSALLPVQRASAALRPMLDHGLSAGETEEGRKQERLKEFGASFNPFSEIVWKHRPFYPEEVFTALNDLLRLTRGEAIEYQVFDPLKRQDYWEKAMGNVKAINDQVDAIAATIRDRLSRARVA
jgi:hypothetical protein